MSNTLNEYIQELHKRQYNLFSSIKEKEEALFELNKCSYLILDEQNTVFLKEAYIKEYGLDCLNLSDISSDVDQPLFIPRKNINKAENDQLEYITKHNSAELSLDHLFEYDQHMFFFQSAFGYYNQDTKLFHICAGSLISGNESEKYYGSTSSKARARFLENVCSKIGETYRVVREAKCRNANAAACYVAGDFVDYTAWRDKNGESLQDIYPKQFFNENTSDPLAKTKPNPVIQDVQSHRFYIERVIMSGVKCKAEGYYDVMADKFVILKGSLLAEDISSQVRFSTTNYERRKFLNQNCMKNDDGFILKKDFPCDNPAIAAYYATGIMPANGWMVWKDSGGESLKNVYKK